MVVVTWNLIEFICYSIIAFSVLEYSWNSLQLPISEKYCVNAKIKVCGALVY